MSNEVDDLFARAVIGLDEDDAAPSGDATGWSAIRRLHVLADRSVLDAALAACAGSGPLERRVGAAVLGQLGHTKVGYEPIFVQERHRGLIDLLLAERAGSGDPTVLSDTCLALGHLHDPRAIPALLDLSGHPDVRVRRGVVSGLSGHEAPEAIDGLIALSADADGGVRDWATFGLGTAIGTDSRAVRAALHARLDDPCAEAREEAILGLAKRGDRSVLPAIARALRAGVSPLLLEAATLLAAPELCGALAAAATGRAIFDAAHGSVDLTEDWIAAEACGC